MEKQRQIQSILNGETPERPAYSFWTHFPEQDLDAAALAETTYSFYKDLDLDLIKSMPNGMFSVQDWGCQCDFSEISKGGVARVTRHAVEAPSDWARLEKPGIDSGAMGRELDSLNRLLKKLKGEAPVVATVFSPMTTAYKLSGGRVLDHLPGSADAVNEGLALITEVTCRFAQKAVSLGCAGIFLATQLCTADLMTADDYAQYARPFDLAVLEAVKQQAWLNLIHVHGSRIHSDLVAEYPVQGMSWHIWETPPGADDYLASTREKIIVGGIQRMGISQGRLDAVNDDIRNMLRLTDAKRLILAPGCTIRHPCKRSLLKEIAGRIRDSGKRSGR